MPRTLLATALLLVLLPVLIVANASTWATQTVLDGRTFTATVGRSLDAPAVERAMADAIAAAATARIMALDPEVRRIGAVQLGLPADVDAAGVRAWIDDRLVPVLRAPEVAAVRDRLVLALHQALLDTAGGDGAVRIRGGEVVVDAGPVYDAVVARLAPGAADVIAAAPGEGVFVLARADEFAATQRTLRVLEAVRVIVPLLVAAIVVLIVILAHQRVRALGGVGVALIVAGLVSLATAWIGGGVVGAIPEQAQGRAVATEVYDAFAVRLVQQSMLLVLVGLVLAVGSWVVLRRRRARTRRTGQAPSGEWAA